MARYDKKSSTGCVNWPVHLRSDGQGGMTVYALWPERSAEYTTPGRGKNAFYQCFPGFHIKANVAESPLSSLEEVRDFLLYGALCLGTSGGSWVADEETGDPWIATLDDLTPAGLGTVAFLNAMYGRDAVLVTVVDT